LVRIRERLGAEVPITSFFNAPTIAAVASFVSTHSPGMRDVLDDIDSMSEEEAQRLLAEESAR
jgi:hypothetical protein